MRTETIGIRFTPEERALIEKIAKDEYLNVSILMRKVILEYVNEKNK